MFPLSTMLQSFIRTGSLTVIDARGAEHVFGAPGGSSGAPDVTMRLTDPSLYRKLFLNPELHAGEAYMDGRMSFPGSSLRDFLMLFSLNRRALAAFPLQKVFQRASKALKRFQQANPVGKAQQNVAHHYDIGNAFYELFLDEGLFYSCAYFREEGESLEAAQINKCRLIAAKLQLKPGMKVLDIGSGWGGLAMYLARAADVE
ncbi:MAG: class I SAM-dependent methyltransferase, partial [Hyphomicrobiales bacterium]|nr:class I SAM-dependent methyltransferase [Hyphomicrobiales bacterium]